MASNPHLQALHSRIENRFSHDALNMPMSEWICRNTTIRGRPYSFKGYEFQRVILDDMHPNMDVRKCSQVGLTEGQIRKALGFLSRNRGVSAIMTYPDEKTFKKNSTTRIKPILDRDDIFNGERDERSIRNMSLYQVGESFMHVTGCTESDATSTPADMVQNDEVDISPQDKLVLFTSRLQNSDYKINQRFSTPSFPSFGIDAGFQTSDQRSYMVRCDGCGHWNIPEFTRAFCEISGLPDHIEKLTDIDDTVADVIDITNSLIVCEKCRAPLDLGRTDNREWVAKYPGRTHARGYDVSPFCTPRLPLSYIIPTLLKFRRREYIRGFYNTVLGLTYSDGNIRLEVEDINACFTSQAQPPQVSRDDRVWVSLDMGQTCHFTAARGNEPDNLEVFRFETVHVDNLQKFLADFLADHNVVGGAIDRHPYEPTAQAVFEQSKGVIVPTEYRGTREINLVFDAFKELTHSQIDRTAAIDEVVRQIRRKTVRFSGYMHMKAIITEHLRDMIRDEKPDEPARWVKLTGQDHFFHSLAGIWVAMKIKDLERVKSQADIRTEVFSLVGDVKQPDGLLGRKDNRIGMNILGFH